MIGIGCRIQMLFSSVLCQIGFGRFLGQYIPVPVIRVPLLRGDRFTSLFPIRLVCFQHHKRAFAAVVVAVKGFILFFSIIDLIGQHFILIVNI